MPKINRSQALIIAFSVSVIGAVIFFVTQSGDKKPPPSEKGYYSGPMRAKMSTRYGDDNGKEVAPPPGSAEAQADKAKTPGGAKDE